MTVEAIYGFNEYLKAEIVAGGEDPGNFYPGRMAPLTETSNIFVTYKAIPNEVYDLFGLKEDRIMYTFYNSSFDTLQKVLRLALKATNVEDIQTSTLAESGIIYQDAQMVVGGPGETTDVDGEEFFFLTAEVKLMYTEA